MGSVLSANIDGIKLTNNVDFSCKIIRYESKEVEARLLCLFWNYLDYLEMPTKS